MMDVAYAFERTLVESTFTALTSEKRVLHFAAQPRAHKLVHRDIEQKVAELRPAIQLYPPNKLRGGDAVLDLWSGLVAIVARDPDQLLDLASDLIRAIEPYGDEPKMSDEATSEYIDGPGYEVVLIRFRFKIRRE